MSPNPQKRESQKNKREGQERSRCKVQEEGQSCAKCRGKSKSQEHRVGTGHFRGHKPWILAP